MFGDDQSAATMKMTSSPSSDELTNHQTEIRCLRHRIGRSKTMPEADSPPPGIDNRYSPKSTQRSEDGRHNADISEHLNYDCERLSVTSDSESESSSSSPGERSRSANNSPVNHDNPTGHNTDDPSLRLSLQPSTDSSSVVVPDPFPELSTSPPHMSASFLFHSESAYSSAPSSGSSPETECALYSNHSPKHTPKKRALESGSTPASVSPPSDASSQIENQVWTDDSWKKTMLNFYHEDRSRRPLSVDDTVKASDACYLLVLKSQMCEDKSWAITEHLSKFNMERTLEDHESVLQVYRSWGHTEDNKFYFRKDFRKYEFFHNPSQFFPSNMLDAKTIKHSSNSPELVSKSERQKNLLLQNLLESDDSMPDIQGYLYMREGKKSWKKHYFVLRRSGLYYSSKGTSKEPRHLVLFSQVTDANIYTANNSKKTLGAPNNNCFCLKPLYVVNDIRELKLLCAEDEQSRSCWVTALRIVKYGNRLKDNFKHAMRREDKLKSIENHHPHRGVSQSLYVRQRAAVDFSSHTRIVSDPNEAIGVAIEEESRWRKKSLPRPIKSHSVHGLLWSATSGSDSNPRGLHSGVHVTHPWFHSGVSREEAVKIISEHGLVDGVFLVRESHSNPNTYVLSLSHNHKVKHCQIHKIVFDGKWYFSLDKGITRFSDLVQLIEFYQLNANGLPTKLTHYVTRLL